MKARTLAAIGLLLSWSAYARSSLAGCQTDMDCKGDRVCQSGECVAPTPKPTSGVPVMSDDPSQPPPASTSPPAPAPPATAPAPAAADHHEETRAVKDSPGEELVAPHFWVGISATIDLNGVPSASDVCKRNPAGTGPYSPGNPYVCLSQGGSPFPGSSQSVNNSIVLNKGDQAAGGLAHGPASISATFDWAFSPNALLGARLGFEVPTMPTGSAFAPVRLEARLTYLFGDNPLLAKFAPLLLVGMGVGEFDAYVPVTVGTSPNGPPTSYNAWITGGPFFLVAGVGGRIAITDIVGLTLALKGQGALGGAAGFLPGFAPEVGVHVGF